MKRLLFSLAKRRNNFYLFLSLLISLPFILTPLINPDLFWHLSAGKYIFKTLSFPRHDFLSWLMNGKEWIDFEWLTQIIYYSLYLLGGFKAFYIFKIILVSINLTLLGKLILSKEMDAFNLLWLIPLGAASLLGSSDIRPENFSLILFSLCLLLLEKEKAAPSRTLLSRETAYVAGLFALWANLHGGFTYGLVLLGVYFIGTLMNENLDYIYGKTKKIKFSSSGIFLGWLGAALLAALLNPYGLKIYSVAFSHYTESTFIQDYIMEWNAMDITNPNIWPFMGLLLSSMLLYAHDFIKHRRTDMTKIFLLLFFVPLAANYVRFFSYATIILMLTFADSAGKKLNGIKIRTALSLFSLSLCVWYFFYYASFFYSEMSYKTFAKKSSGVINFLKKNKADLSGLKMYNMWTWGGYLGWNLNPDYKVFVDGRYIFVPYLEMLTKTRAYLKDWESAEKEYGFNLIVMEPTRNRVTIKQKLKDGKEIIFQRPLYLFLMPPEKWATVYFDREIFVSVRRDSVPASWLTEHEYKYLRPDDFDNISVAYSEGKIKPEALKKEVYRYLRENDYFSYGSLNSFVLNWYNSLPKRPGLCKKSGFKPGHKKPDSPPAQKNPKSKEA